MDFRSLGSVGGLVGGIFRKPHMNKPNDRWRIRRRLIVSIVLFGLAMVVAGAVGLFQDRFTGELVFGGVTLISAVLTAYSTMATFDDKWQKDMVPPGEDEVNPDG